ncbi:cathepsin b, putative, partial [Perkinsus marinus ATCC 50983]
MVDKINLMQNSWTASKDQPPFKGTSIKDVPTGSLDDLKPSSTFDDETRLLGSTEPVLTNLPSDFDARQKFASCAGVIGHVRSNGCNRGNLIEGLNFMKNHGIVTGNEFKPADQLASADGCWPYPLPKCNHASSAASQYPKCPSEALSQPACQTECINESYKTSLQQDLHRAKSWGRLPTSPQKIKQEIFDNGTVLGVISMYEDFRLYKSGVYVHTTGGL